MAAGDESAARYSRAGLWIKKAELDEAIADYTRVIDAPNGAPVDLVARAFCNRGYTWGQKGHVPEALADFARVIEGRAGASKERIADALAARGWLYYAHEDARRFLDDTEAALRLAPRLESAMYNLGLALLAVGRDADAVLAYRHAAEKPPQAIETTGLRDLTQAANAWLQQERAAPFIKLLKSSKK